MTTKTVGQEAIDLLFEVLESGLIHPDLTEITGDIREVLERASKESPIRRAVVSSRLHNLSLAQVQAYMPANYQAQEVANVILISGRDNAGWTLDDYVIPRLASGLIFAHEYVDPE